MKLTGTTAVTVDVDPARIFPLLAQEILERSQLKDLLTKNDHVFIRDGKLMGYIDYGHHRGGDRTDPIELPPEREVIVRALLTVGATLGFAHLAAPR